MVSTSLTNRLVNWQVHGATYNVLMDACVDAVAVQMRKFAAQGGLVALTSRTYGSLFRAYGRDVEKLGELWNEMEQREVMPTSVTAGCFVQLSQSAQSRAMVHRDQ